MGRNVVALSFLAGLGQGVMGGMEKNREKERQDAADQRAQEDHDARMEEARVKKQGNQALLDAAKPVAATDGATVTGVAASPTTYDSADVASSDVRQANRLAEETGSGAPAATAAPTKVVNGTAYPDATSADAAAAAANTPQAIRARQVAAVQGIDPERALKLQATALQVDAAQAAQAKKLQDEGIFDALKAFRSGDGQGMKEAFNKSGQFKIDGDVKLTPVERDIPGVGKITTYNATFDAIGPDGQKVTKTYNSHDLSMQMMPYEKALDLEMKGSKEQREAAESTAKNDEAAARAGYYRAYTNERNAKANGTVDGKPFKLDEDDKLRLTNSAANLRDAQKQVQDALGKLMPGDDPTKNPAVVFAQNNLRAARLDHMRTNIELNQVQPEAMANQILGIAKNPQDVMRSLNELASVGGTDFADKVATTVQASDQWKRWNPQKAAPVAARGAAPRPAAAAGIPAAPAATPGAVPAGAAAAPAKAAATPVDAAGQRLDTAREMVRRLKAQAPGLAQGQQAIAEFRDALRAAQEEEAKAQAQYEELVAPQAQPYFGRGRPAAAQGISAAR